MISGFRELDIAKIKDALEIWKSDISFVLKKKQAVEIQKDNGKENQLKQLPEDKPVKFDDLKGKFDEIDNELDELENMLNSVKI